MYILFFIAFIIIWVLLTLVGYSVTRKCIKQSIEAYDRKQSKLVATNVSEINFFEQLADGSNRFELICNDPYVKLSQMPIRCFQQKCGFNGQLNNGKCECEPSSYNYNNMCIPNEYKEMYLKQDNIALIRTPCFNGRSNSVVSYPCYSNTENFTMIAIKAKLMDKQLLDNVKLFNY